MQLLYLQYTLTMQFKQGASVQSHHSLTINKNGMENCGSWSLWFIRCLTKLVHNVGLFETHPPGYI